MKVTLIAAVDPNGVMGKEGGLPWPSGTYDELKYFKQRTLGGYILMGSKTWDSLPVKPLPGRTNMVVSTRHRWEEGAIFYDSIGEALFEAGLGGVEEIFIIGGANVFQQVLDCGLDIVDRIILTHVFDTWEGDVKFPLDKIPKDFDKEALVTTFSYQIVEYSRQ